MLYIFSVSTILHMCANGNESLRSYLDNGWLKYTAMVQILWESSLEGDHFFSCRKTEFEILIIVKPQKHIIK